jgi:hypothetical protein
LRSGSVTAQASISGNPGLRLAIILMAIFCVATLAAVESFDVNKAACAALTAAGYSPWQDFPGEWVWVHFVPGHVLALATPNVPKGNATMTWLSLMLAGLFITPRLMGVRGQPYRRSVVKVLPLFAGLCALVGVAAMLPPHPRDFTLAFDNHVLTLPDNPDRALPLSAITAVQVVTHVSSKGHKHISIMIGVASGQSFALMSDQPAGAAQAIRDAIEAALTSGGQTL